MTTRTMTYSGGMRLPIFPILFLIGITILAAMVIQLNLHSVANHADESEAVKQACGNNPLGMWKNTTKFYRICGLPDGSFGIQVLIKNVDNTYREVTSFIRKTHGKPVKSFSDVIKYVEKACEATKLLP